jgi:hypothetical protein
MFFPAGAWTQHDDCSRVFAQDIELALAKAGLSHKAAAILMDISEAQLSRQLSGHEQLSAWRLQRLPTAFHKELTMLQAERQGLFCISQVQMAQLVQSWQQMQEDWQALRRDVRAWVFGIGEKRGAA